MSLSIDIRTTGVQSLDQAAKGFIAFAEAIKLAADGDERLIKAANSLIATLKKQEAAAKVGSAALNKVADAAERAEKAIKGIAAVKLPFTQMSSSVKQFSADIKAANEELVRLNRVAANKLSGKGNYSGHMEATRDTKAAILLQEQLNSEIQTQVKLTAELATLRTSSNTAVSGAAKNLKVSKEETAVIRNLVNAERLLSEARLGGNAKAIKDAENLVAMNRSGVRSVKDLAVAYEKLAGVKKAASVADKGTEEARIRKQTTALKAQESVLGEVKTRLQALSKTKMPVEDVKRLEKAVKGLNLRLERTGSTQASGINKLRAELKKLETQFLSTEKKTIEWGKSAKYAIGGVARSMGAMTYSYAMLAPLIAGMAVGAAVKKIYELGAAFEYTTTYVDALATSLDKMSVGDIGERLLSLQGLRKGPEEMAMGMKEFAKAGVEASQSIGQIAEMSKFASIAEMELGEAVKLVIGQSKAFGIDFTESANMISAAALSSATSIKELGTALSYTTELSTVSGVKFDEVATAMAIMANAGIRGSKAGTAIRTSVIKMQAPSTKLKKTLDALGISWSAFTEEGQIKNLRTMFSELKKVTDALPPAAKVSVLKELFGLRAIKGGANVLRSMGDEWDTLNLKIRDSIEGVSFIDETYDKLSDTATAKWEELGAAFQKALIQAFDSDSVKGILDDLKDAVSSDALVKNLQGVASTINLVGTSLGGLLSLVSKISGGSDLVDVGLIGYALFGKSPYGKMLAALIAIKKQADGISGDIDAASKATLDQKIANLQGSVDNTVLPHGSEDLEKMKERLKHLKALKEDYDIGFGEMLGGWGDAALGELKDLFVRSVDELDWDRFGPPANLADQWDMILKMGDDGRILAWIENLQKLGFTMKEIESPELMKLTIELDAAIELDEPAIRDHARAQISKFHRIAREEAEAFERGGLEAQALQRADSVPIAIKAVHAEMQRLDDEIKYDGLEGWAKQLADVDKQVKAFIETQGKGEDGISIDINLDVIDEYRQKLIDALVDKGTKKVQESIEDLSFQNMITELDKSTSYLTILAGKTAAFNKDFNERMLKGGKYLAEEVNGRVVLTDLAKELYKQELEKANLGEKSQKQQLKNEKDLKAIRDVSFEGVLEDLKKITELAEMSAWDKQLAGVEVKLQKIIEKAKAAGEEMSPEQETATRLELEKALDAGPARKLSEAIGEITFSNMTKELEDSIVYMDILRGKTMQFERDFFKEMKADGRTVQTDDGETILSPEAQRMLALRKKDADLTNAAYKQFLANEKELKGIRDVSFDGLMADLKEVGADIDLSSWEQQVKAIDEKYEAIAEKAKAINEPIPEAKLQALKDQDVANLLKENIKEAANTVENIKFDKMVAGLRRSGTIAGELKATLAEIERTQMQELKVGGLISEDGLQIHPKAQAIIDGLKDQAINNALQQTNELLREADAAIKEINYDSWLEGLNAFDKRYAELQRSIKNHPIIVSLGKEAGIDTTQLGDLDELLKSMETRDSMQGLTEEMKIFLDYLRKIKPAMEEAFDKKNIQDVKDAIREIKTDNMIQGLKDSKDEVDQLRGAYTELRDKVEDFLVSKGEAERNGFGDLEMTALGKRYLKAMMDGVDLLGNKMRSLNDELKDMMEGIRDEEFDLELKLMSDAGQEKAILARVDEIKVAADAAGKAGGDGWREQLRLLEKAKGVLLSMSTDTKDVTKGEVANAKRAYEYYLRITRGGKGAFGTARVELNRLRDEYVRLAQAEKAGEPDPKAVKEAAKARLESVQEINKEKLAVFNANKERINEEGKKIVEQGDLYKTLAEKVKGSYKETGEAAGAYGLIVDANKVKVVAWADKSIEAINGVTAAYKRMNAAAGGGVKEVKNPIDGARAVGGPVKKGGAYIVGEKGQEVFVPDSSGYIIPNDAVQSVGISHGGSRGYLDNENMGHKFNTFLPPEERKKFVAWMEETGKRIGKNIWADLAVYDVAGFWEQEFSDGMREALKKGEHGVDTFKKPNHPTFSDESQYSNEAYEGGSWHGSEKDSWRGGEGKRDLFQPSQDQLVGWDYKGYQDWLDRIGEQVTVVRMVYDGISELSKVNPEVINITKESLQPSVTAVEEASRNMILQPTMDVIPDEELKKVADTFTGVADGPVRKFSDIIITTKDNVKKLVSEGKTEVGDLGETFRLMGEKAKASGVDINGTFAEMMEGKGTANTFDEFIKAAEKARKAQRGVKEDTKDTVAVLDKFGKMSLQDAEVGIPGLSAEEMEGLEDTIRTLSKLDSERLDTVKEQLLSSNATTEAEQRNLGIVALAVKSVEEHMGDVGQATADAEGQMDTSANAMALDLNSVLAIAKDIVETLNKVKLPSTEGIEARAVGGPVTSGDTYLVGEKGPELFSPKSSGFIIPNDKISGSRNVVDINLSVNGAEPVTVQGTKQTVDQLKRAFRDSARYAA